LSLFLLAFLASGCLAEIQEGRRALQERKPGPAAEVLQAASGKCPGSAELYDLLGIADDMLGQAANAERAFREAIRLEPRTARPRTNLAVSLIRTGRQAEALRELEAVLAFEPANQVANANLAAWYTQNREFVRALRSFNAIGAERSAVVRQDPKLLLGLVECLLATGQSKRALTLLPQAAEDRAASFRFSLGTLLAGYGLYREAIQQMEAVPAADADAAVFFNLGLAHSHLRQYAAARECYFAAIDRQSEHADAYFRVGVDFAESGENAKAIPWLFRARRIAPQRADVVFALSEELIASGYFQTASAILDTADLRNPLLRVAQGDCALEQQRIPEALGHYRGALEIDSTLAPASIGFARALAAWQKQSEALEVLQELLARDPANVAAHAEAGHLEAGLGNCTGALLHLENAWRKDSSRSAVALDLAHCYRRTKQAERGLRVLLSIRAKPDGDRAWHYELSQLYAALGRSVDAEREGARTLEIERANQEGMRFVPPTIYIH
jgi:tetratricopeptide (TPR) repeat protein